MGQRERARDQPWRRHPAVSGVFGVRKSFSRAPAFGTLAAYIACEVVVADSASPGSTDRARIAMETGSTRNGQHEGDPDWQPEFYDCDVWRWQYVQARHPDPGDRKAPTGRSSGTGRGDPFKNPRHTEPAKRNGDKISFDESQCPNGPVDECDPAPDTAEAEAGGTYHRQDQACPNEHTASSRVPQPDQGSPNVGTSFSPRANATIGRLVGIDTGSARRTGIPYCPRKTAAQQDRQRDQKEHGQPEWDRDRMLFQTNKEAGGRVSGCRFPDRPKVTRPRSIVEDHHSIGDLAPRLDSQ